MRRFGRTARLVLGAAFVLGVVGVSAPGESDAVACDRSVLFVAGSSPAPSGDRSLLDAVDAWSPGCVTVADDDVVTVDQAEAADVVVMSSSVLPATLGDRLVDAAVPVVVSEPFLFDEMAMTAANGKELAGRTTVRITDPSHPLAGGLSDTVSVFTAPGRLNYGLDGAAPGVEPVANTGGDSARQTIFGFPAGSELTDRTAPAGRVGFFASFGAQFTGNGVTLVHAALDWLLTQSAGPVQCGEVVVADLVLDRDLVECPGAGLVVGADDVTIDLNGFTVDGSAAAKTAGEEGIDVGSANGATVRNGTIQDFFYGIEASGDGNTFEDLTLTDNAASIEFVFAHDNVVRNNVSTTGGFWFVRMTGSDRNLVEDNVSTNSRWGVIVANGEHNEVVSNDLRGGFAGGDDGVSIGDGSTDTNVRNNTIEGFEFGIEVQDASDTTVQDNSASDNDIDGIRVEAAATATTVGGNTADDNGEWGIRAFAPVIDAGGNSATGNGEGQCLGVDCALVAPPRGLLVAGNTTPPPGDRDILEVIEAAGVVVTIADDDSDLAAIDTSLYDVIFVSTSVVPSKVGDTFKDVAVPVVVWEGFLFDDMALAASGETTRTYRNLTIVDPDDPLAGGLPAGDHRVYRDLAKLSYGRPSPAANVVAHEPSKPDRAVIFSYDQGDELVDGSSAAGLRLGLFMSYPGSLALTDTGLQLVGAGVEWTLAGGPPGNDDFADRIALSTGTTNTNNFFATLESGEPVPSSGPVVGSLWWTWTAPATGTFVFDTSGSSFDTILTLWTGNDLGTLAEVATNDDEGDESSTSRIQIDATVGTTYQLSVAGADVGASRGLITLNLLDAIGVTRTMLDPNSTDGVDLILDASANPVISYGDDTDHTIKVLRCNDPVCDGGDDPAVVVDTFTGGGVGVTAIDLDSAGRPVVAYTHSESVEGVRVAACGDADCAGSITVSTDLAISGVIDMALDAADNPVIAVNDRTSLWLAHCNDTSCSGGDESIELVDQQTNTGLDDVSLRLNTAGHPVVAYWDYFFDGEELLWGVVKVAICNDADCAGGDESIREVGETSGADLSLALDALDRPLVAYVDDPNFIYTGIRYVRCSDANCTGDLTGGPIDDFLFMGRLAIDVGPSDLPIIAYHEWGREEVKITFCRDDACAVQSRISVTPSGEFDFPSTAIALDVDAAGNPVLAYADWNAGNALLLVRVDVTLT